MQHHARHITTALLVALALVLGACGDSASTKSANITFRTDPAGVQVWIDGTNAGTTPVVVSVEDGTHGIEFKRDGFEAVRETLDVKAGNDLTVTTALAVTGTPEERVHTLLAALGIPEHETIEPKAHRAPMKNGIMLYWPQKKVRKGGLSTWRIEIDADYEDDGDLVFKKGKKELHRAPFRASGLVMEGRLPASVVEALSRGSRVTWGIDFENKRKKDVMAKFVVDDGKALERKLERLVKRSVYRRAGPLEREMAKIELKRNYRYYTESLTDAMSVLNTWPDTVLADKIVADSLQRLQLKESMLYLEIMKRIRGRGTAGGRKAAGLGTVARPLAPSLVAPKVRAPTPKSEAQGGLKAGGGVGIKPTGGDQKREPGPIEGSNGPGTPGVTVDPAEARERDEQARRNEVMVLQEALAEQQAITAQLEEAEQRMAEANQAVKDALAQIEQAGQAVTDAEQGVRDAEATGDPAKIDAAKAELDKAMKRAEALKDAAKEAEQAKAEIAKTSRELMEQHGSAEDARNREKEIQDQIEQARQPKEHEQNPDGMPTPDRVAEDPLAEPGEEDYGIEEDTLRRQSLETEVLNAKQQLQNATDWIASSEQAAALNKTAYEAAIQEMDDAEASGDQARIDAAEQALGEAHENYSRSAMELERANAAKDRAGRELERAEENLDEWDQGAGQREADKNDPAKTTGK